MTRLRRRGVSPFSFLAAVCLIVFTSMAQTTATERLVQLLKTDDPTSAMAEILQTTIDAGPPAISSLEPLINGPSTPATAALVGSSPDRKGAVTASSSPAAGR